MSLRGEPTQPFVYKDKGIMAMIGRNAAVAEVGKHRHQVEGPFAFAAWLGVHAMLLSGVHSKIDAFLDLGVGLLRPRPRGHHRGNRSDPATACLGRPRRGRAAHRGRSARSHEHQRSAGLTSPRYAEPRHGDDSREPSRQRGWRGPQHPRESFAAANSILTKPADCGLSAGPVAIVLGALLVFFMFPRRDEEQRLLRRYHAEDVDPPATGEPL